MQKVFRFILDDDPNSETFDECKNQMLCEFFIPFVEFLGDCQINNFQAPKPVDFNQMRERFVDLAKFIIEVFEPSSRIMDDCVIKSQNYDGMVTMFNRDVVGNFLHVNPEVRP